MTATTTHRLNFQIPGTNDFIIEDRDEEHVHYTSTGRDYLLTSVSVPVRAMILDHRFNGYHPDCILCQDKARKEQEASVTLEAMQVRSNVISNALKTDDLGSEERESLWRELAEIAIWIEREYAFLSDIGDAKICARFGTQL